MTVSGSPPANRSEVEFLPVSQSQDYIQKLALELEQMDGAPLFLAHDGESETSTGFISDGETHLHMTGSMEGSVLHAILSDCVSRSNAFRIWWASDEPDDHSRVVTCTTLEEVIGMVIQQITKHSDIAVRWKRESANTSFDQIA